MASILLIEHHDAVRTATALMLERDGHEVTARSQGRGLLRRCQNDPVDVLIVDETTLQQEGVELFHAVRKLAPDVTIIVMSGGAPCSTVSSSHMTPPRGIDAALQKPIDCHKLRSAIREASTANCTAGRRQLC